MAICKKLSVFSDFCSTYHSVVKTKFESGVICFQVSCHVFFLSVKKLL